MEVEGVGVVVADCSNGTALVTMTSVDGELDEEAATAAVTGAGNYTVKSVAKVEDDE